MSIVPNPLWPTRDADMLGFGEGAEAHLVEVFRDVYRVGVEDNGLRFDPLVSTLIVQFVVSCDSLGGICGDWRFPVIPFGKEQCELVTFAAKKN
jgi:hypothetical protein